MRRCCAPLFLAVIFCTIVPAAFAEVRVWEGTLTLPTYEESRPDPNPPFDQYSANTNYPYTLRDQLSNRRVDHAWRAIFVENEYLKCSILPDLGGHIYTCQDKLSGQSMFYANPSIKKADIGYRGGWAAFGIEFNFPVSHNWVTLSPVDYSYRKNDDGSASVFVGNIDRVYGMQWEVEIQLHPGSTVLELKVTLYNRSDVRHRFYWWSNAGVQVWDDSRICYPTQFTAAHGFVDVDSWPVNSRGIDLSVLKDQTDGPVSRFAYGTSEPFMGLWHPHTDTGVVHYAEYEELPGKKIWSWGSDADALDWRKVLSDNDSAYMEVQGGLFRNQETYAFLEPQQAIHFTEYWMPVRGLGGIVRANLNAVANLERHDGAFTAYINANQVFRAATIRILDGNTAEFSQKLDLEPDHTWSHTIAPADSGKHYTLDVLDAKGALLLQQTEGVMDWTPKLQVRLGLQEHDSIPTPDKRTEDDWVQFCRDEELQGARLRAAVDYQQALSRYPGSLTLQRAAGRLMTDLLRYQEAVEYLEPAQRRETWNSETAYYLGVAYDGLGREREAKLAFEAAGLLPDHHAAATLRLAEIKAREGNLQSAANELTEIVRTYPNELRAAEELAALEHALGLHQEAETLARRWLLRFPTSEFLREQLGQQDDLHLAADVSRILNTAAEYMRLGLYGKALIFLSRDYPPVPADQREPAEIRPQNHPLIAYYRGYCRQKLGRSPANDFAEGARLSTEYVFPSGAVAYQVLQAAVQANARDANALYLLGTLEFSVGMIDTGLDKWQRASLLNPRIPALDWQIGRALLQIKGDTEAALAVFKRGVNSDDPTNLGNYIGMDQALSLLERPAQERVSALRRYRDNSDMPTNLVYELALNLAEAGDDTRAEALFHDRFFSRTEGGTNVRQVWVEVGLQHALHLAQQRQCEDALQVGAHLGLAVPGLDFTQDGLGPVLASSRNSYLLGTLYETCAHPEQARVFFQRAAHATGAGNIAWAYLAAQKLGSYDEPAWAAKVLAVTATLATPSSSWEVYNAAMLQRVLRNEAAAEAGFRQVFSLPDSRMAYHLSRLALRSRDEQ